MKIIDKQTIRIPSILSVILIVFAFNIFFFFSYYRQNEFYAYLQSTCINIHKLVVDEKVNVQQLYNMETQKTDIYNQTYFIIYDSTGHIIYKAQKAIPHLNESNIKDVLFKKIEFNKDGFEYILFTTKDNLQKKTYILEASGYDIHGFEKQRILLYFLIFCTILSIIFIAIISRYYIRKDLKPIDSISKRMRDISSKNLQSRIPEADLDNEIGDMAFSFNQLLDRLNAAYQQQQNFVSYATHELRTPLSIMQGNAQVTLMKERTKAEYQKTIENFQIDINGMTNLVNSLLELARMNSGAQLVPFNHIRIDDVLWTAVELVKKKNPQFNIQIEFILIEDEHQTLMINANSDLLNLVFRNLIENGCKYSTKEEVFVKIKSNNHQIELNFIDQGNGISATDINHIFDAFYRTDKTKKISGHGIGLPLSKKIIEIHNGEIIVESKEDVGSVFTVKFPSVGE